jgi:hypothetical protein
MGERVYYEGEEEEEPTYVQTRVVVLGSCRI